MPFFALDDQFHMNPKVLAAGNGPVGLYARCGSYCADQLTDGFIPEAVARQYGAKREIAALLAEHPPVGALWVKVEGGYRMPDYLDYNPSRDEVLRGRAEKHEKKAAAGRLGGVASGIARRKQERSNAEANGEAEPKQTESKTKPPTPLVITSPSVSTSQQTVAASGGTVDNSRRTAIAEIYGRHAASIAGKGDSYAKACTQRVLNEPRIDELITRWPDAPDDMLAASIDQASPNLRYYEPQPATLRVVG